MTVPALRRAHARRALTAAILATAVGSLTAAAAKAPTDPAHPAATRQQGAQSGKPVKPSKQSLPPKPAHKEKKLKLRATSPPQRPHPVRPDRTIGASAGKSTGSANAGGRSNPKPKRQPPPPPATGGATTAGSSATVAVPPPRAEMEPPATRSRRRSARRHRVARASAVEDRRQAPARADRPPSREARPGEAGTAPRSAGPRTAGRSAAANQGNADGQAARDAGAGLPQPLRAAREVIKVIPTAVWVGLAALGGLCLLLGAGSLLTLVRNRKLARQRRELLGDVGLLQAALLPEVPEALTALTASIAYRPADGPAAGGDFYDVIRLTEDRTAFVVGDVSGHGRAALARTALTRYTIAAYIEAGLEPQEALQMAGAVLAGKLQGDFVTALVAVHDPQAGTLTYATAGHPAPIVLADDPFEPILAGTPPPLGAGVGTGQRQTILPFPRGTVACLFTDGLLEARTGDGRLGRARLEQLLRDLGPAPTAEQLINAVTRSAGTLEDDAAVCMIRSNQAPSVLRSRQEQIDLTRAELRGSLPGRFLRECGLRPAQADAAERDAAEVARATGGVVLQVQLGEPVAVTVRSSELFLQPEPPAPRGGRREPEQLRIEPGGR